MGFKIQAIVWNHQSIKVLTAVYPPYTYTNKLISGKSAFPFGSLCGTTYFCFEDFKKINVEFCWTV